MRERRGWWKVGWLAAEALASVVLVLASFGLFMSILYYFFPTGTSLKELISAPDGTRGAGEERKLEGTLVSLFRDVRLRRGTSIAWGEAREGTTLYSQDAVQTLDS